MKILAIDPGPEESAYVEYDPELHRVLTHFKRANEDILAGLKTTAGLTHIVLEKVECFGKPVGAEVFETVFWSGRFWEAAIQARFAYHFARVGRRQVKLHLCGSVNGVTDPEIRQRLIDLFGPGKEKAIGKKDSPGPLYGIKADCWAALALAVTFAETRIEEEL